ncbi:MAG: IS607 family transposase [Candidatus Tectomicrobia bacterium]|nr:IS607 family transposase [Candidatus Tectomicrobia bacterium]
MNTYNVRQFADLIGVSVSTLQRWDRQGRLQPRRTPSNRRLYTDEHLARVGGPLRPTRRTTAVYARVSSQAQKPDLDNQVRVLEQFCAANGWAVDEWIREVGGGLDFGRRHFLRLLDAVVYGRVERLVVAHRDRLCRFGFEMVEHLCRTHDCDLVVMNQESLSPEGEMAQDMLSIVDRFSARLHGLEDCRASLEQALEGDRRIFRETS